MEPKHSNVFVPKYKKISKENKKTVATFLKQQIETNLFPFCFFIKKQTTKQLLKTLINLNDF